LNKRKPNFEKLRPYSKNMFNFLVEKTQKADLM